MISIRIYLFALIASMVLASEATQAPIQPPTLTAPQQLQQQQQGAQGQGKPEVIVIEKDIIDTEDGKGDGNEEIIEKRNGKVVSDKVCPVHHDHPDYKHCHKKQQAAKALAQASAKQQQKPVRMLAQKFKQ